LKITVYFSASEAKPGVVAKSTVIYGDPLQLGSTVGTFLYHGAKSVSVFPDPAAAKKAFAKMKRGEGLLAGEREGQKIPGFQLGGLPLDSIRDKVKDRTICLSSPDAGPMFKAISGAVKVYLGGFVNLGSVYEAALREGQDIVVIAAGYEGKPNLVDTIFAGLVADFLQNTVASHPIELAESAKKAANEARLWQGRLWELLHESNEGKLLLRVGAGKNLDFSSKLSRFSCAPVLVNGAFSRDIPPKMVPRGPGEGAPPAPRKGKPIKVQVPLFPKNPEMPTPGLPASAAKAAAAAAGKAAQAAATDASKKKKGLPGSKQAGKRAPLFSKKTVAPLHVKVGMPPSPIVQAATDALKAALLKKDAKKMAGAPGAGKPAAAKVGNPAVKKPVMAAKKSTSSKTVPPAKKAPPKAAKPASKPSKKKK
jgi:2-phosphosulfolactate phosphatase